MDISPRLAEGNIHNFKYEACRVLKLIISLREGFNNCFIAFYKRADKFKTRFCECYVVNQNSTIIDSVIKLALTYGKGKHSKLINYGSIER